MLVLSAFIAFLLMSLYAYPENTSLGGTYSSGTSFHFISIVFKSGYFIAAYHLSYREPAVCHLAAIPFEKCFSHFQFMDSCITQNIYS